MNVAPSRLWVAVQDSMVFIKIAGRANVTISVDFKRVLLELEQRGFRQFVLDLASCLIMDSTFLGVLAGFRLKMGQDTGAREPLCISLLNPNPRVTDLLDNLGLIHLFKITSGDAGAAAYCESSVASATTAEIARTSLEAHQALMTLNPANVPKFKDVAQFLAEDLAKLERKDSTS
jgi:anti-sigma B factor antagonist